MDRGLGTAPFGVTAGRALCAADGTHVPAVARCLRSAFIYNYTAVDVRCLEVRQCMRDAEAGRCYWLLRRR